MKIAQLLNLARQQFSHLENASLSAEILLGYVLNKSRTYLFTHEDESISPIQQEQFLTLIRQRAVGEPIAYLIGKKEFWSLELQVNHQVLIPRPETELLIEWTLQHFSKNKSIKVADLGTGSGAIALALAKECPAWQIMATDISAAALEVAEANAKQLQISNVEFKKGNWCEPLAEQHFDLIITNPPYIDINDSYLEKSVKEFEPNLALFADKNGLAAIQQIVNTAMTYLHPAGCLLVEHGFQQAASVQDIFHQYGYQQIFTLHDLNGLERATGGYIK